MEREIGGNQDSNWHEEFQTIKAMIEKTKRDTAESGTSLILWGWLVIAGCIATYVMAAFKQYSFIWVAWLVLVGLGVISNIAVLRHKKRVVQASTYIGDALTNLWIACGVAMTIVGFVGSLSPVISYKAIFPLISVILGIGTFATGGIVNWRLMRMGGLFWWAAGILMMFVSINYHPLILGITVIPGYMVPGYMLRAQYKSTTKHEHAQAT
jgi:MFS family permease